MKTKTKTIETALITLNVFKQSFPEIKTQEFMEYIKDEKLPYYNMLPTAMKKYGIISSSSKGFIKFQKQPIHINGFRQMIEEIKNNQALLNKNYKNKEKFLRNANLTDIIFSLEDEGYKLKGTMKQLTTEDRIKIAKLMGLKVLKEVSSFEEI